MKDRAKRKIHLFQAIAVELIIMIAVSFLLFWAETQVMIRAAEKKLRVRAESISQSYTRNIDGIEEVTRLYDGTMQAKAESLAFLLDNATDVNIKNIQSLCDVYAIDKIYVTAEDETPDEVGDFSYYTAKTKKGFYVTIRVSSEELDQLVEEINTEDELVFSAQDMYFIVNSKNKILLWEDEDETYMGHKLSEFDIDINDFDTEHGSWVKMLGTRYYAYCYPDPDRGISTVCAISYKDMTTNSRIAVSILNAVILLIFTVLVAYAFFGRQEEKRSGEDSAYARPLLMHKLKIYVAAGLIIIGLVAFYIQSLYALSLHSLESEAIKSTVITTVNGVDESRTRLEDIYNNQYLSQAKIIAKILSYDGIDKTEENLGKLSDIFGLEYIMLFDGDGKETVSDSPIYGFEISDDPESQSYVFSSLKHGVEYVIQEPRENDLTGEYTQYIGVPMYTKDDEYDGFLQICIVPDKLAKTLSSVTLENVLYNAVSGSENSLLAVDRETNEITYYSANNKVSGKDVREYGVTDEQIKSNYLGNLTFNDKKMFADSFDTADNFIYILVERSVLFSGRPTMAVFTVLVSFIGMALYTFYFSTRDVVDPVITEDEDPYVDVIMADENKKRTLNIVARVQRNKSKWSVMTPEEKTARIIQFVVCLIGMSLLYAFFMRDVLYTDETIFGYIIGNRWNKGFNIFALTNNLIFLTIFWLIMTVVGKILDTMVSVSSPKSETVMRLIRSLVKYVGVVAAAFYCLNMFDFDTKSLLASAGILTLIIGLGAQDLITDILAGLSIIFENEFQVGDIIEVNGFKGKVVEIGIRTTRLMNTRNDIKSVNNRNLTNVINKTRRNSNCDVLVSVGFSQDIDAIEAALEEELPKLKEKCPYIISGPTYGGIDDMSGRRMVLSIRTECVEAKKFEVRAFVNREIKNIFDKYGFQIGGR